MHLHILDMMLSAFLMGYLIVYQFFIRATETKFSQNLQVLDKKIKDSALSYSNFLPESWILSIINI